LCKQISREPPRLRPPIEFTAHADGHLRDVNRNPIGSKWRLPGYPKIATQKERLFPAKNFAAI
jgi:hypothetical protein